MGDIFPGWIEERFLSDEIFGAAYDMQTPEERARLKTAIARIVAACGGPDTAAVRGARVLRQGFCLHEQMAPAAWAIILWDGTYVGATRILAALLPAVLAGVPQIIACRVAPVSNRESETAFPAPVLAALELAGQELVADLRPEEALRLIHDTARGTRHGRVVLLGESDYLDRLAEEAARCGTSARRLAHSVRIGVDTASLPEAYAMPPYGILQAMHPDALFTPLAAPGENGLCAVFCGESAVAAHLPHVPLVLTPDNEGCWAWPDLSLNFFRNISLAFGRPEDSV